MKIRVFTAFSGYDSQCLALERLKETYPGFDYELVGWSEIDKYAIQAHNALFPQWADRNYGDIAKIDWSEVPDFDLFTYSSPCQDFSNAGKQAGGEKGSGTRSSLLWECQRAIEAKRPAITLMENVAALVGSKFIKLFNEWQLTLNRMGYTCHAQVLNSKDYGVPQTRDRTFLVGMLDSRNFYFPEPFKLDKRLKDVLEPKVDEKYYLSDKMMKGFSKHNENHEAKGTGFKFIPKDGEGYATCIRANAAVCPTDNFIQEPLNPDGLRRVEPKAVSYTRDKDGKTANKHLNDVVNTIHQSTGHGGNTDCLIAEPKINIDNNGETRVFEEINETNTREVLRLLWSKVGEEEIQRAIGGFLRIFKEEILRQGLLEESPREGGEKQSGVQPRPSHFEENSISNRPKGNEMRDMWVNNEHRCASQGFQLSEQFTREFNDIVSQLSYEDAQTKECVSYLRRTCEGAPTLQQTLASIQEVWRPSSSTLEYIQPKIQYRIRKLTPVEVFRLMGVDDADIDTIQSASISNSQMYKLAGNSIVVDVLFHLFRKMYVEPSPDNGVQTLF